MATISWPEELPATLETNGLSAQYTDPVLRTEMDAGPRKARLRYTAAPQEITGTITVGEDKRAILDFFYRYTCGYGALRFNMTHPQTLETVEMRFRAPPKDAGNDGGLYKVSLSLEKI